MQTRFADGALARRWPKVAAGDLNPCRSFLSGGGSSAPFGARAASRDIDAAGWLHARGIVLPWPVGAADAIRERFTIKAAIERLAGIVKEYVQSAVRPHHAVPSVGAKTFDQRLIGLQCADQRAQAHLT